jgi:hypothetical protein
MPISTFVFFLFLNLKMQHCFSQKLAVLTFYSNSFR